MHASFRSLWPHTCEYAPAPASGLSLLPHRLPLPCHSVPASRRYLNKQCDCMPAGRLLCCAGHATKHGPRSNVRGEQHSTHVQHRALTLGEALRRWLQREGCLLRSPWPNHSRRQAQPQSLLGRVGGTGLCAAAVHEQQTAMSFFPFWQSKHAVHDAMLKLLATIYQHTQMYRHAVLCGNTQAVTHGE